MIHEILFVLPRTTIQVLWRGREAIFVRGNDTSNQEHITMCRLWNCPNLWKMELKEQMEWKLPSAQRSMPIELIRCSFVSTCDVCAAH